MICVADEISLLTRQEQQLHQSLDNLRGQTNLAKDRQQIEKELRAVLCKRHSLQAWKAFELGMPVHRLNSSRNCQKIENHAWRHGRSLGKLGMAYYKFPNNQTYYRLMLQLARLLCLSFFRGGRAASISNGS